MNIVETKISNHSSRIFEPDDKVKDVLIAVHGFAGDKDSSVIIAVAKELVKFAVLTITFELPNHGADASQNILNLAECINSIGEVVNYAKAHYSNTPISIFATSFGAFLTLHYLSTHTEKFKNIILRSPAIDMANILVNNILPEHNLKLEDFSSVQNLGYANPLLVDKKFIDDLYSKQLGNDFNEPVNTYSVLQGLKDDIVDPNFVFEFCNKHFANRCTIYKFKNADHRYKNPGELEQIVEITKHIITKY